MVWYDTSLCNLKKYVVRCRVSNDVCAFRVSLMRTFAMQQAGSSVGMVCCSTTAVPVKAPVK